MTLPQTLQGADRKEQQIQQTYYCISNYFFFHVLKMFFKGAQGDISMQSTCNESVLGIGTIKTEPVAVGFLLLALICRQVGRENFPRTVLAV